MLGTKKKPGFPRMYIGGDREGGEEEKALRVL